MDFLIIPLVALVVSLLTFFSGFGLGTLLTPVFAIFFPLDLAIAMTAVVHLSNNIFKVFLVGKHAKLKVVLSFGLPAIFSAMLGAWLAVQTSNLAPLYSYTLFGKNFDVLALKLVIAGLMILFTLFEVLPVLKRLEFDRKFLPIGGVLSGFFGGLSGHQGALRSAFLARAGLTKEQFIATGVTIAVIIDVARIRVYSSHLLTNGAQENWKLVLLTTLCAFLGAYLGSKSLKKITMQGIQKVVSVTLVLLALALGGGLI